MKKERNSTLELLRILCMFLIVSNHFCVYGGFGVYQMDWSIDKVVLLTANSLGFALDAFFMLSGYFLIDKKFKISRIIKIMLQVLFYSVFIYIAVVSFNIVDFSKKEAITNFFPILFSKYPFASAYVIYSLSSPFLNTVLNSFSKKQFEVFLISIFVLWSLIPTITLQNTYGAGIGKFILFYTIGAYARKFPEFALLKKQRYLVAGGCVFYLFVANFIYHYFSDTLYPLIPNGFFYSQTGAIPVLLAYSMLLIFSNIKSFSSKIINAISGATFGIYLIHENPYMRKIIWNDVLNTIQYKDSAFFLAQAFLCVLAVFVVCGIIETIRIKFIETPFLKKISPLTKKLDDKVSEIGF